MAAPYEDYESGRYAEPSTRPSQQGAFGNRTYGFVERDDDHFRDGQVSDDDDGDDYDT